jgi:hypothetical protein
MGPTAFARLLRVEVVPFRLSYQTLLESHWFKKTS